MKQNVVIKNILLFSLFLLFVLGGLGTNIFLARVVGLILSFIFLFYAYFIDRKLFFPKGFLVYLLFLLLFAFSVVWSFDKQISFEILLLFISGGVFWLAIYNLQDKLNKELRLLLIGTAIVFAALFFLYLLGVNFTLYPGSLFLPISSFNNHNHIGDLWALVFVLLAYQYAIKKQKINKSMVILSFFLIAISFSRSAYIAVLGGIFYLFKKKGLLKKYEQIFSILLIVFIAFFTIGSLFKSTLGSRPYFVQAILGAIDHPFGVGVGSFDIISSNTKYHLFGMSQFSYLTHNVFLEFISGMGILGLSFIAWIIYALVSFNKSNKGKNILFQAIFLTLTINFFFDATYFIPTMTYLWFIFLGLAQEKK